MKKYLLGFIAIIATVATVAFTVKEKKTDPLFVFSSPDGSTLVFEGIDVPLPDGCPSTPAQILCGRIYLEEHVTKISDDPLMYEVTSGHEDDWEDQFFKQNQ